MTRKTSDLFGVTPQGLPEVNVKLLTALAETGLSRSALIAMLDLAGIKLGADHRHFLTGPVVQRKNGWEVDTPGWLYDAIPAERLAIVLDDHAQGRPGWQIGHAELATVLYPYSLEAPLQAPVSELYLWACGHAVAARDGVSPDEIRRKIDFVSDGEVLGPAGRYFHDHQRIASDIRRTVIRHQKARERDARRQARPSPEGALSTDIVDEQLDLF